MTQDRTRATSSSTTARRGPVLEALPELTALTLPSPIRGSENGFGFLDVPDLARRLG